MTCPHRRPARVFPVEPVPAEELHPNKLPGPGGDENARSGKVCVIPFLMPESTPRHRDPVSANWRICPTSFEPSQRHLRGPECPPRCMTTAVCTGPPLSGLANLASCLTGGWLLMDQSSRESVGHSPWHSQGLTSRESRRDASTDTRHPPRSREPNDVERIRQFAEARFQCRGVDSCMRTE